MMEKMRKNLPRWAVYARYLLPALLGVALFALSFADGVRFFMNGRTMKMSLFAFYKNTLTSAHTYLAGTTDPQANWFYGLLAGGAILFALIYLAALGLSVMAAITACRAFDKKQSPDEVARMKVIFKIAFANRKMLFFANCLYLVPVLFPEYFSAIGRRFLSISGRETVYVDVNAYLIVTLMGIALTLALALVIRRYEYSQKMNMFLISDAADSADDVDEA